MPELWETPSKYRTFLRSLYLKNFKSVKEAKVELRPLTVLVGKNSAGKSSLMQSLLIWVRSEKNSEVSDHLSLNQENSKLTSLATTLREGTSVPLDNVHIGFEFEVAGMNTIFEARSRWEQLRRMETAGENLRTTFSKTVELSSAYALLDEEKNPGLAKIDSLNMKFSTRQLNPETGESENLLEATLHADIDSERTAEISFCESDLSKFRDEELSFMTRGRLRRARDRMRSRSQFQLGESFEGYFECDNEPVSCGKLTFNDFMSNKSLNYRRTNSKETNPHYEEQDIAGLSLSDGNPDRLWISVDPIQHALSALVEYWCSYMENHERFRNLRDRDPQRRRKSMERHAGRLEEIGVDAEHEQIVRYQELSSKIEKTNNRLASRIAGWVNTYFLCLKHDIEETIFYTEEESMVGEIHGGILDHWEFFERFTCLPYRNAPEIKRYQEALTKWFTEGDVTLLEKYEPDSRHKGEPFIKLKESFDSDTDWLDDMFEVLFDDEMRESLLYEAKLEFEANFTSPFKNTILRETAGIELFKNIQSDNEKYFRSNVFHLGPLRWPPSAFSQRNNRTIDKSVGYSGENTTAQLIRSGDRVVLSPRLNAEPVEETLEKAINYWMGSEGMSLFVNYEARSLSGVLDTLTVKPKGLKKQRDLTELGVGVSQVLPVVVQALLCEPGDLLLLEEPELHLHPALQQKLGDFLLAVSQSGRQVILETHSEYLISRLALHVAEDPNDEISEQFVIYLTEPTEEGTQYFPAEIDRFGAIDWPKDFFDEGAKEAIRTLYASLEKQEKEKK